MESNTDYQSLAEENRKLKEEIALLRAKLRAAESQPNSPEEDLVRAALPPHPIPPVRCELTDDQIGRYSRQLILPEFGVTGQVKLCNSSVLIVGAGGLGSPAALYLAAAGVGQLGIVDYDVVDKSNLHRQVIHTEANIGKNKAASAREAILRLNSSIECEAYAMPLDAANAAALIAKYDVVIDATDNVATRYLLNDSCVVVGRPLISGSALRSEGQITVYNYRGGPCYRCLFPTPPPPETVTRCSDGGVLGVVPGIIGCLQALEAIKVLLVLHHTEHTTADNAKDSVWEPLSQRLLLFDATSSVPFRSVKLRPRNPECAVCGDRRTMDRPAAIDYEAFCGSPAHDRAATDGDAVPQMDTEPVLEVSVNKLAERLTRNRDSVVVLDVREEVQFRIVSLPNSLNVPLRQLTRRLDEVKTATAGGTKPVFCICRRGVDSLVAARMLVQLLDMSCEVKNVTGGLLAWKKHVDPLFPMY